MRGILESELLGKTIFCHILENEYAASATSQQMYHSINQDVMLRWTYPLVPDNMFGPRYQHSRINVYKDTSVHVGRSSKLKFQVICGPGTHIGENTIISHSAIGKNCTVGNGVKITNSFIFDNVIIEDRCFLEFCIVGFSVSLKRNVILGRGSLVGSNVIIGPNITIPDMSRIANSSEPNVANNELGDQGQGYFMKGDESEDDDSLDYRNTNVGLLGFKHNEFIESIEMTSESDACNECDSDADGKLIIYC